MGRKRVDKRQPTAEEKARNFDNRLKSYAVKSAISMAEEDLSVKKQVLAQILGIKFLDEDEIWRKKLLATIDEAAVKKINENPDYASNIADRRIRQLMQEWGLIAEGEEWPKRRPTLDDMLENFKKVKELEEIVGAGKSKGPSSELVIAVLQMIGQIIDARKSPTTSEGKDKLVPQDQPEQFDTDWEVQPIVNPSQIETTPQNKGNETVSESEITIEAKEEDGKEGIADSDD